LAIFINLTNITVKELSLAHLVLFHGACKIKSILGGLPEKSTRKEKFPMLFSPKEKGQGLVEYALILVLVAIVVIAALMILGPIIGGVFSKINSSLSSV
jgi:pilus assembly protein Flp/PilA